MLGSNNMVPFRAHILRRGNIMYAISASSTNKVRMVGQKAYFIPEDFPPFFPWLSDFKKGSPDLLMLVALSRFDPPREGVVLIFRCVWYYLLLPPSPLIYSILSFLIGMNLGPFFLRALICGFLEIENYELFIEVYLF